MNFNGLIESFSSNSLSNIIFLINGIICFSLIVMMIFFKKKKKIFSIGLFISLFIFSFAGSVILLNKINYGLDLQGGFEVLYQIKPLGEEELTSDMVTSTYKTIAKRINVLGVSEPEITIEGEDRIRIRLAGVTEEDEARKILSSSASLTFRDAYDNLLMTSDVLAGSVKLTYGQSGRPAVLLPIKDTEKFYEVTSKVKDMKDNIIVIWLDFKEGEDSYYKEKDNCGSLDTSSCLSAASVNQAFSSDVVIEGNFTTKEAKNLVLLINSGALPTSLEELSSRSVSASFGESALNKTLSAGLIGLIIVILLMTFFYHLSGFVSSVCVIMYMFLSFLIFYLIGGVLTLPGIAAMLLGIGMAVDASVISFERIKECLKEGKNLKEAFASGNKMSFSSIIDANITTLIVAIVLFILGESSIKGFATMLIINIVITVLVMVYLNRWLLSLLVKNDYFNNHVNLFINYKEKSSFKKFHFVNKRKYILPFTLIFLVCILSISLIRGFNFGVDFAGGSNITVNGDNSSYEQIKDDLKKEYTLVKEEKDDNYATFLIKEALNKEEEQSLKEKFETNYAVKADVFVVSQIVREELIRNGLYSLLFASIGIVIYVSIRFKFNYAISAVIALLHDILVVIGLFGIFHLEITSIFIAAILTIIGYSINDTIVTFDRIRENYKMSKDKTNLEKIVDTSVSETLFRTILTTVTTLMPVFCLMFFGAREIINFNIALFFGFVAGVYSSIFVSNQLWYILEKNKKPKKENKKDDDEPEELLVKGINS